VVRKPVQRSSTRATTWAVWTSAPVRSTVIEAVTWYSVVSATVRVTLPMERVAAAVSAAVSSWSSVTEESAPVPALEVY